MGEIFGIGIEELIFIGILLALLFGPESIPRLARMAGGLLNRMFRSPFYKEGLKIRKQINDLPAALARLAQLEKTQQELNAEISGLRKAIDTDGILASESMKAAQAPPAAEADAEADHSIAPPPSAKSTGEPQTDGAV